MPLFVAFLIFAVIYQNFYYEVYMMEYKDFCISLFWDTYVTVVLLIYLNGFWRELRYIHGVKDKIKVFLSAFHGSKFKNIVIQLAAIVICVFAIRYYLLNEFSGLFNEVIRVVIGIVYILYMILPIEEIKAFFAK
jgi:hypothetical protein